MKKWFVIFGVTIFLLCSYFGFGSAENSSIVGSWKGKNGTSEFVYKFRADNSGLLRIYAKENLSLILEIPFVYKAEQNKLYMFPPISDPEWTIRHRHPDSVSEIEFSENRKRLKRKLIKGNEATVNLGEEQILEKTKQAFNLGF